MAALTHIPDRLVSLPYRKGEKNVPEWSLCLHYIAKNHSSCNSTVIEETLTCMARYHNAIVKACSSDASNSAAESFMDDTLKKYCQLVAMAQAHLPLSGGKVHKKLKFLWYDSLNDRVKYDSDNSNVELGSCIYNLAAMHTAVGAQAAHTGTLEGIKDGFRLYQSAAGYYNMVEEMLSRMPTEQLTRGDFRNDHLQLFSRIAMAHAHHCGYLKAEDAMKGKHDILSKIAMQGAKLYEEVHSMITTSFWIEIKASAAKEVEAHINACKLVFFTRAHLHLAVKNEEDKESGIAIAYYIKAKEYLAKMPKMPTGPLTAWVNSIVNAVNAAHDKAEKFNSSVFYSRVPTEVPTPDALPRPLGQATAHPIFSVCQSVRGEDPFFGIVPAHIAPIAKSWRDEQRNLVDVCSNNANNARATTAQMIQQLGVMVVIHNMSSELQDRGRVPEPLRTNILKLRHEVGQETNITQKLIERVNACSGMLTACNDKMQEIVVEITREKKQDEDFLSSYGGKIWRTVCPPSEQTPDYNAIMAAYDEYKKGMGKYFVIPFNNAKQSLDANLRDIARLGWNMSDLDALMPFVLTKEAREQSGKIQEHIEQLKKLLEQKETVENEQVAEQRALHDLIESDTVTFNLSAVEAQQQEAILLKETQRITDAIERVNDKTRRQNAIVGEAEKIMEALSTHQSMDPVTQEIQKVSNSLENACNVYRELIEEFNSVLEYGSKILNKMDNTLSAAKSYTLSRQLQGREIQEQLNVQIAQKMSEMQHMEREIADSRRRQGNLQQEIQALQRPTAHSYFPHQTTGGSAVPPPPPPQSYPNCPFTIEEMLAQEHAPPPPPNYQPPADLFASMFHVNPRQ